MVSLRPKLSILDSTVLRRSRISTKVLSFLHAEFSTLEQPVVDGGRENNGITVEWACSAPMPLCQALFHETYFVG